LKAKEDDVLKNRVGRRGIAFAIDALFAIAVIAAFAISVVPVYSSSAADDAAPYALSKQSTATLRSMCLATVSELSAVSPEISGLYSDGNLTANDSEMTACQLVARLSLGNAESAARAHKVVAEVYGGLAPQATGLAVYANNARVYNTTFEPASPRVLHSSTVFVYTYGKAGVAAEPLGPVKMEVRAWWP
jgi:hypothetical protein